MRACAAFKRKKAPRAAGVPGAPAIGSSSVHRTPPPRCRGRWRVALPPPLNLDRQPAMRYKVRSVSLSSSTFLLAGEVGIGLRCNQVVKTCFAASERLEKGHTAMHSAIIIFFFKDLHKQHLHLASSLSKWSRWEGKIETNDKTVD